MQLNPSKQRVPCPTCGKIVRLVVPGSAHQVPARHRDRDGKVCGLKVSKQ